MPLYTRVAGQYKRVYNVYQKIGGVWVRMSTIHTKSSGKWKLTHTAQVPFVFTRTLTSQNNFNLRDAVIQAGWDKESPVIASITIPVDAVIGSTSSGSYAFSSGSSFPEGSSLTLTVYGKIVGCGGKGGNGGTGGGANPANVPETGGNGGPAVFIGLPTSLLNFGTIAGGGGGGGGGTRISGYWTVNPGEPTANFFLGGGGAGGGQGYLGGAAGLTGPYQVTVLNSFSHGTNGSITAVGSGGRCSGTVTTSPSYSGLGGAGGIFGNSGASGAYGYTSDGQIAITNYNLPGVGGLAGLAITGIALVTLSNSGSILGNTT